MLPTHCLPPRVFFLEESTLSVWLHCCFQSKNSFFCSKVNTCERKSRTKKKKKKLKLKMGDTQSHQTGLFLLPVHSTPGRGLLINDIHRDP